MRLQLAAPRAPAVVDALRRTIFAYRLAWDAAPLAVSAHTAGQMLQAVLPAVSVKVTSELVDAVRASVNAGLGPALRLILLQALLALAQYGLGTLSGAGAQLGQQRTAQHVLGLLAVRVQGTPFDQRQTTQFHEQVAFLRFNAPYRAYQIVHNVNALLAATVTAAGVVTAIGTTHWHLGSLVLAATLPTLFAARRAVRIQFQASVQQAGDLHKAHTFYELLLDRKHAAEIAVHRAGEYLRGVWRSHADRALDRAWRAYRTQTAVEAPAQLLNVVALAGTTAAFAGMVVAGTVSVGGFVAGVQAMTFVQNAAMSFYGSLSSLWQVLLYVERLHLFIAGDHDGNASDPGAADSPMSDPKVIPLPASTRRPGVLLELEEVSFRYPGSPTPALRDVTLGVREGEILALAGPNGAGKTTLLHLMAGVSAPSAGRMRVAPILRAMEGPGLTGIGLVAQEFLTLHLSLFENVTLGGDGAEPANERKALQVLNQAGAGELVRRVGLHRPLGPEVSDGQGLSRGEWQRIALARALYRDPRLLLLDEPTASADGEQRQLVRGLLHQLRRQGTAAVVATHDPLIAAATDRVVLLQQGQVVAEGDHEELLRAVPMYRRLMQRAWVDRGTETGTEVSLS